MMALREWESEIEKKKIAWANESIFKLNFIVNIVMLLHNVNQYFNRTMEL